MIPTGQIILHAIVALITLAIGVAVIMNEKILVVGKLSGGVHDLSPVASIVIGSSFFMVSGIMILLSFDSSRVKKPALMLIFTGFILFTVGFFL